jgi:hypothetical protein
MTAAGDRREELEAAIWRSLARAPVPLPAAWKQAHVAAVLAAADAYAKARRAPRTPAEVRYVPAVHYATGPRGHPACRPGDWVAPTGWAVAADAQAVTCGHCRKTDAWHRDQAPHEQPEDLRG